MVAVLQPEADALGSSVLQQFDQALLDSLHTRDCGQRREEAGLRGGPDRVVTGKAIFGFHPETRQMMLESIHTGTTLDDVLANMGFTPAMPEPVHVTGPPDPEQLRSIGEVNDPRRISMG